MHSRLLTVFFLLLALTARSQTVAYLFVDSSKAASGAGTSWSGAYKTLNEALNVANSGSTGTAYSVFVAKGTYYPTGAQSSTNRDSTFALLRGGLRVYGGYPTGGGLRNVTANPTVLSGAIGSATDSTDNSYHVVLTVGIPATSDSLVLDGLTVTRGAATGTGNQTYGTYTIARNTGGGMVLNDVFKTALRSCRFLNNYTSGQGGGMYLNYCGDTVRMDNVDFQANSAASGGGLYSYLSSLAIARSSFTGNIAGDGGGLYYGQFYLGLKNTVFTGNKASVAAGGAMEVVSTGTGANVQYDSLTFTANTAATGGGAVYFGVFAAPNTTSTRFRACTFTGNATTSGGGGALAYFSSAPLTLDTCTFATNKTGLGNGGAVYLDNTAAPITMTGDVFTADSATASNGGAVAAGKSMTATSCTFTGNYCSGNGGASLTFSTATPSTQTYRDCTFDNNVAGGNGGALIPTTGAITRCRFRGNVAASFGGSINQVGSTLTVSNSLFSGNKAASGGAITMTQGNATITNCTLSGDSAGIGKGVYAYSGATTLLNCIVWEGLTDNLSIQPVLGTPIAATYCTVRGGYTGTGNSSADPLFVAPLPVSAAPTTGGNYALTACSPAINAGQNNGSYTGVTDVAGNPRLAGVTVDQGAYEFVSASVAGTISGLSTGALCTGKTAQLTSSVAGGTWSNPAPTLATVSSTGLVTAGATPGTDTVVYTVVSNGCSVQNTQVVTILAPPTIAAITGASSVCVGFSTQLSSTTTGGTWVSANPTIASVNGTTGFVVGLSAGTAVIRYRVTNAGGCSDSVSKTVTVAAAATVGLITPTTAGVCPGGTLQLSNATPGGVWSSSCTGGSILSVSTTGLVTGIGAGGCTVSYTVTNGNGCVATANRIVTVYATPAAPVITGPATVCAGTPTTYTATPAGVARTWSVSNTSAATITTPGGILTGASAGGTTDVVYTYTNATGCTATSFQTITVNAPVTQSVAANLCSSGPGYVFGTQVLTTAGTYTQTFPAANGCDSIVTLTLTGTPRPDTTVLSSGTGLVAKDTGGTYQWVRCEPNGTQTLLPGKTGRVFVTPATGSYAVVVMKAGCSATSGCHAVTLPTAGIAAAAAAEGWALYPNPTTGSVTVQTGATAARTLTVTDATGKRLLEVQPAGTETVLHLEGFAPGLYLVTATDAAGASRTMRVTLVGR